MGNQGTWCTDAGDYADERTDVPSDFSTESETSWYTASDTSSETDSETSFQTASETQSLFYRDYDWNELPVLAQEAAAKFGYTTAAQWTNQIDFGTDSEDLSDDVSLSGSEDMSNAPRDYATSEPTE